MFDSVTGRPTPPEEITNDVTHQVHCGSWANIPLLLKQQQRVQANWVLVQDSPELESQYRRVCDGYQCNNVYH